MRGGARCLRCGPRHRRRAACVRAAAPSTRRSCSGTRARWRWPRARPARLRAAAARPRRGLPPTPTPSWRCCRRARRGPRPSRVEASKCWGAVDARPRAGSAGEAARAAAPACAWCLSGLHSALSDPPCCEGGRRARASSSRAAAPAPAGRRGRWPCWVGRFVNLNLAHWQAAEAAVEQEEPTLPAPGGRGLGLYACEYAALARVAGATARGRMALLHGDARVRARPGRAAPAGARPPEPVGLAGQRIQTRSGSGRTGAGCSCMPAEPCAACRGVGGGPAATGCAALSALARDSSRCGTPRVRPNLTLILAQAAEAALREAVAVGTRPPATRCTGWQPRWPRRAARPRPRPHARSSPPPGAGRTLRSPARAQPFQRPREAARRRL